VLSYRGLTESSTTLAEFFTLSQAPRRLCTLGEISTIFKALIMKHLQGFLRAYPELGTVVAVDVSLVNPHDEDLGFSTKQPNQPKQI
jgi:DNA-binding transcriptional LysR family regulator